MEPHQQFQPIYDADQVLAEIADVVPFFKGATRERLGKLGLQWPVKEDGTSTKILHTETFKLDKVKSNISTGKKQMN